MSQGLSVLLVGATGLVGHACLLQLIERPEIDRVVVLTRSAWTSPSAKVAHHRIDFSSPASFAEFAKSHAVICALGTTIRQAGSQAAFRAVDYDYVWGLAQAARQNGAAHFLLVSSMSADEGSRNFYLRTKGEIEAAVSRLGYESVSIVRPSLLLGARKEVRPGERVAQAILGPLRRCFPKSMRPVRAEEVAAAVVQSILHPQPGLHIINNADMV